MSLVNDMLNDLDARKTKGHLQPSLDISLLSGSPGTEAGSNKRAFIICAVIILLALVACVWYLWRGAFDDKPISVTNFSSVEQRSQQIAATEVVVNTANTDNVVVEDVNADTAVLTETELVTEENIISDKVNEELQDKPNVVEAKQKLLASRPPVTAVPPKAASGVVEEEVQLAAIPDSKATVDVSVKTSRSLTPAQIDKKAVAEAKNLLAKKRYLAAEQRLQSVISQQPESKQSTLLMTNLLVQQGRFPEAQNLLNGLQASYGDDIDAVKASARLLMAQGNYTEALVVLEEKAKVINVDNEYYELMGGAAQRSKNFVVAEDIYRNLIRVDADRGDWWVALGISLDGQSKPQEAIQMYRRATQLRGVDRSLLEYARSRLQQAGVR